MAWSIHLFVALLYSSPRSLCGTPCRRISESGCGNVNDASTARFMTTPSHPPTLYLSLPDTLDIHMDIVGLFLPSKDTFFSFFFYSGDNEMSAKGGKSQHQDKTSVLPTFQRSEVTECISSSPTWRKYNSVLLEDFEMNENIFLRHHMTHERKVFPLNIHYFCFGDGKTIPYTMHHRQIATRFAISAGNLKKE